VRGKIQSSNPETAARVPERTIEIDQLRKKKTCMESLQLA
jgi:hypothetical protein